MYLGLVLLRPSPHLNALRGGELSIGGGRHLQDAFPPRATGTPCSGPEAASVVHHSDQSTSVQVSTVLHDRVDGCGPTQDIVHGCVVPGEMEFNRVS